MLIGCVRIFLKGIMLWDGCVGEVVFGKSEPSTVIVGSSITVIKRSNG